MSEHGCDQFGIGTEEFNDLSVRGGLRAYPDGDDYVINGKKSSWVSNAAIASHMVASLTLISDRSVAGQAIAFIPLDLAGCFERLNAARAILELQSVTGCTLGANRV